MCQASIQTIILFCISAPRKAAQAGRKCWLSPEASLVAFASCSLMWGWCIDTATTGAGDGRDKR